MIAVDDTIYVQSNIDLNDFLFFVTNTDNKRITTIVRTV